VSGEQFGQAGSLICLVRHGEAKSKLEDFQRSLTDRGQQAADRIAAWAAAAGLQVAEIQHSGKARAEQTAAAFARHLRPEPQLIAAHGLNPNDEVRSIGDQLRRGDETTMLVGHLPFLSRLTSYLVIGNPDREIVQFTTTTLVVLRRERPTCVVACVMRPEFC
jgi:phosphohistidine phosphatase